LSWWRTRVVSVARRAGAERPLRTLQRTFGEAERWRDWLDNRQTERLLEAELPRGGTGVDIGACTGDVLAAMVRCAPEGRHLAFEPLPELADALRRRFPQVDVRSCALWSDTGTRPFHRVRDRPWYSGLSAMGRPAGELDILTVDVRRLDDVLDPDCAPHVIKIDVEGAEAEVLRGARMTLTRHRPIVVFEHGRHAAHFGATPAHVYRLLSDGPELRVFDIDGGGPYDLADFEACVRRGELWTFVARP
jgi:FkbM family methyltransferase